MKTNTKIMAACTATTPVVSMYDHGNDSTQNQLRLWARWTIAAPMDSIQYPKDLSGQYWPLWREMADLSSQAGAAAQIKGKSYLTIDTPSRSKSALADRETKIKAFFAAAEKAFLADYRRACTKKHLRGVHQAVTAIQAEQKILLEHIRCCNSEYVARQKKARADQAVKNTEALASGRFWEAARDAVKGFFSPPFDKNYLADVSEKWRAALFLECESVSYKWGISGWGHKLQGTGRGFLCGIDDNGDQWGRRVNNLPHSYDEHGNAALDTTVEEAMCEDFKCAIADLSAAFRQGDLLFVPREIPEGKTLTATDFWKARESHTITAKGLERNGRFFRATGEIRVEHTSHAAIALPAGGYEVFFANTPDAD